MSRRTNLSDSSLELLLDTICNTFGGILFISILIVILLNMTSEEASVTPPDQQDQVKLSKQMLELAETTAELNEKRRERALQQQIEQQVVDPKAREAMRELRQKQQQLTELRQQQNSALGDIGKSQEEINEIAQHIKDMTDATAAARKELAAIEEKLKQERKSRSQTAKLPKVRTTLRRPLPVFLKQGRLCSFFRRGPGGQPVENKSEFKVRKDSKGSYAEPVVSAGLSVNISGGANRGIERRITEFDSNKFYLQVLVWPDSFEHFLVVKQLMVANNFEYNLVPIPENQKIYFGAASGPQQVQ